MDSKKLDIYENTVYNLINSAKLKTGPEKKYILENLKEIEKEIGKLIFIYGGLETSQNPVSSVW